MSVVLVPPDDSARDFSDRTASGVFTFLLSCSGSCEARSSIPSKPLRKERSPLPNADPNSGNRLPPNNSITTSKIRMWAILNPNIDLVYKRFAAGSSERKLSWPK